MDVGINILGKNKNTIDIAKGSGGFICFFTGHALKQTGK